jgi:epsilon-lactone hydrolase
MPSREALAFWDAMRAAPKQVDLALPARRAAGERAEAATAELMGVTYRPAPEVSGLWAIPEAARPGAAMLYLFGGGYVLGSAPSRRKTAGHLAKAARATVLVPGYRLAPEHPFPAAIEDAVAAYRFLLDGGRRSDAIAIAGDSSGGGLAVACGLAVRDRGLAAPAGVAAISPWADLTCSGASMAGNAGRDIECTRASLLEMAGQYLAGHVPRDPLASPVFGDFAGAEPLLCVVGSEEVLLDDSVRLVRAAGLARNDATLHVAAGMQHVFPIWAGAFPEADREIALIGEWVLRRTEA